MTSQIKENIKGVWGCLPPMLLTERSTLMTCALFLTTSLVFGILLGFTMSWLSNNYPESGVAAQPTALGSHATSIMVNLVERFDTRTQEERLPLAGARVYIDAPTEELSSQAQGWVLHTGGQLGELEDSDVRLSWDGREKIWQISSLRSDAPELALLGWFSLRRSSAQFHYQQGVSGLPEPKAATIFVGSRPANESRRVHSMRVIVVMLVFFCAIIPSLGLLVYLSGVLSFEVEKERASGAMEAFAMASRPIWIMFLARALACSVLPLVCSAIMLSIACVFIGFPSPLVMACVLLCLWSISVVLNLIGQIQVVWFHSQWSRLIGVLLFNPLATSLFILLFFSFPISTWFVGQIDSMASQSNILPLVGWTTPQALSAASVILPVSLFLSFILCAAIKWRLGSRRQGLSRIV